MTKRAHSALLDAVMEITAFLEEERVPYVILGGLAVQHWGEPRLTRDVDIAVMAVNEESFLQQAAGRFDLRIPDAVAFARRSRVLLLYARNGFPIDISLSIPGYESEVMARAVTVTWQGYKPVRLISCEDLIIHKSAAGRPRDLEDVKYILERQQNQVDLKYIRHWLRKFAAALPERRILTRFETVLKQAYKRKENP
jgi:predicted nucleotidyltransferase